MKISDLQATKIITLALGEQSTLKTEDELAVLLKKRLTKKERELLNDKVNGINEEQTMTSLKADKARYDAIFAGAIKKLKNQSVHGDFFYKS